jgi:hypothetical protein
MLFALQTLGDYFALMEHHRRGCGCSINILLLQSQGARICTLAPRLVP